MAVCRVIRQTDGWNVGDHVEADGGRLQELIDQKIVEVIEPDVSVEMTEEKKKPGRPKKEVAPILSVPSTPENEVHAFKDENVKFKVNEEEV